MATILVIDDEQDICVLLTHALTPGGHKVQTAADGDAALDLLRRQPFDLALVDIWLPGLHGLETWSTACGNSLPTSSWCSSPPAWPSRRRSWPCGWG